MPHHPRTVPSGWKYMHTLEKWERVGSWRNYEKVCVQQNHIWLWAIFSAFHFLEQHSSAPRKHFLCWKEMQFYLSFFIATSLVAIVAQVGGSRRSFSMSELENHWNSVIDEERAWNDENWSFFFRTLRTRKKIFFKQT